MTRIELVQQLTTGLDISPSLAWQVADQADAAHALRVTFTHRGATYEITRLGTSYTLDRQPGDLHSVCAHCAGPIHRWEHSRKWYGRNGSAACDASPIGQHQWNGKAA